MNRKRLIVTDNSTLRSQFNALASGDLIVGRVRLHRSEEQLLLDLVERGVKLFPSALSQLASRSKTMQARLFSSRMLPLTHALHDLHDLQKAMAAYQQNRVTAVVTKLDRKNAGMGIHLWPSVEDVFNQASLGVLPFPFVLQPYIADARDIRAIFLGQYEEAYFRNNPDSFRNNLHFGGASTPCTLTAQQRDLCLQTMERGKFPYAHIDLMVLPTGENYLAEINLGGGTRGARISTAEYQARLAAIHAAEMGKNQE